MSEWIVHPGRAHTNSCKTIVCEHNSLGYSPTGQDPHVPGCAVLHRAPVGCSLLPWPVLGPVCLLSIRPTDRQTGRQRDRPS